MSTDPSDKVRILYVEDLLDHSLLVRTFLSSNPDYTVTNSQDGDHAIQLLESQTWDLVITDLNLPGRDGFEVMRVARETQRNVPILATTGYAQEHYWDQAFRAGADQVMVKPLDKDEFLSRVTSMVRAKGPAAEPPAKCVLVLEGLVGDGAMGCGGVMMQAVMEGVRVVILPITVDEAVVSPQELEAAKLSSQVLAVEFRVAESLLGDTAGQQGLVQRVVDNLKPISIYAPANGDTHASRIGATRIALACETEEIPIYGYQTATTGTGFSPTRFVDIGDQMAVKLEGLGAFQSLGTGREDLRPRLGEAYARYWGRYRNFTEVEGFELLRGTET